MVEVLFTPAEFAALQRRDLSGCACVVFDVLRATSVIATALANGAEAIVPVKTIEEAVAFRRQQPKVLLGGERNGMRITADLSGGVEFDLGNSPREYTPEKVAGRVIVTTTTNGTHALRSCATAPVVVAASFLNLTAVAEFIRHHKAGTLLIVCAGTGEEAALEDVLAAGALVEKLRHMDLADSAEIARRAYRRSSDDLPAAVRTSKNARRLLTNPLLGDDVQFCLDLDRFDVVPALGKEGSIRKALPN